jgi:hypothetical protein
VTHATAVLLQQGITQLDFTVQAGMQYGHRTRNLRPEHTNGQLPTPACVCVSVPVCLGGWVPAGVHSNSQAASNSQSRVKVSASHLKLSLHCRFPGLGCGHLHRATGAGRLSGNRRFGNCSLYTHNTRELRSQRAAAAAVASTQAPRPGQWLAQARSKGNIRITPTTQLTKSLTRRIKPDSTSFTHQTWVSCET